MRIQMCAKGAREGDAGAYVLWTWPHRHVQVLPSVTPAAIVFCSGCRGTEWSTTAATRAAAAAGCPARSAAGRPRGDAAGGGPAVGGAHLGRGAKRVSGHRTSACVGWLPAAPVLVAVVRPGGSSYHVPVASRACGCLWLKHTAWCC